MKGRQLGVPTLKDRPILVTPKGRSLARIPFLEHKDKIRTGPAGFVIFLPLSFGAVILNLFFGGDNFDFSSLEDFARTLASLFFCPGQFLWNAQGIQPKSQ